MMDDLGNVMTKLQMHPKEFYTTLNVEQTDAPPGDGVARVGPIDDLAELGP